MNTIQRSLLLFAFFIGVVSVQAQVSFGVRAGYQHASANLTENLDALTPDFKPIHAYSFAAVVDIPLGYGFHIQPEVAYTQKGFRLEEGFEFELFNFPIPVDAEVESRFNYIELPLLMKYEIGKGKTKAYIMGGPSMGYATSGRLISRANLLVDIKLLDTPIDLEAINYERVEWSAVVGGGISYDAGPVKMFADARYQHGFTELYDIPVVDEMISNKSFGINAGFLIPINKQEQYVRP
jgi:hypothetical protein